VRVPEHRLAKALISAFSGPLAAPSANRSGHVSPTTADHVMEELVGLIDGVLDGGPCDVGLESTILGFDNNGMARLLRPGGISVEALEAVIGPVQTSEVIDNKAHLSPSGDAEEAAAFLFAALRQLDEWIDKSGIIAVAPIPEKGLGLAINDRLRRAAAPRP